MKYALDSVFFFQGEIVPFFFGFGISKCMGMYPFILREDLDLMGSERTVDPRFGFIVFFWGRWRKQIVMIALSLHLFCLPPSSFSQICWVNHPGGQTVSFETFYGDNNLWRSTYFCPGVCSETWVAGGQLILVFRPGWIAYIGGNPPSMSGQKIRMYLEALQRKVHALWMICYIQFVTFQQRQ